MQLDALQRRKRYAPPQPFDERIDLRERDFQIFEALHQHGPLPTHYLFELTRQGGENHLAFQRRLTKLYNGTTHRGAFLTRPRFQRDAFGARYQSLIYDLAPPAIDLLAEHGRLPSYVPVRTDPMLHRFMAACVSASIRLEAGRRGLRFICKSEIFAHHRCPESTKQSENPLALPVGNRTLIPDDLFGLQYPDGGYRFFALEADRCTETIRSRQRRTSFNEKAETYVHVLRQEVHKTHWGIPNLLVLTVTTSETHMTNLLANTESLMPTASRFLFKAKPDFGTGWRVPPTMPDLLTEPWRRVSGGIDISVA